MPRLLTLDEVMQKDKLLWVEWIGCNVRNIQATATARWGDFSVAFWNAEVHPKGLYGRQWRCWNEKPTDEQREAVGWEVDDAKSD